ncbi:MAG: hypothetical protein WAT39_08145 [Planctomycetota bacterium]
MLVADVNLLTRLTKFLDGFADAFVRGGQPGNALRTLHVNETPAEDVHMAIEKHLQRPEETIMSTAEKLESKGRAATRIETLSRLLTRRFGPLPPDVEARVRAGTPADFDRWFDRVLDAPNLAGVFAD